MTSSEPGDGVEAARDQIRRLLGRTRDSEPSRDSKSRISVDMQLSDVSVVDVVTRNSHTDRPLKPNSIRQSSSLAGRRPVRDQIPLHYPACDLLAGRSATSWRAGSRAASKLDEDLRVHVVCVSQDKFNDTGPVQLASRSQTNWRPDSITLSSLRSAREQVCDQLASWLQAGQRNGIWPEPCATRFELSRHVEITRTCLWKPGLRPGLRPG